MDDFFISTGDDLLLGGHDGVILGGDENLLSESETLVGPAGPPGPAGPAGKDGRDGVDGQNATVSVGTTTTGAPGTSASVVNTGTTQNAVFNFTIPAGVTGSQGPAGSDGINGVDGFSPIASVEQTEYGAEITITDSNGTTSAQVVNGSQGEPGTAATVSVGSTTTGAAGTSASVVNSGTSSAAVLDFVIPRGADGTDGTDGTDGFSPIATVSQNTGSATITITDKNGTTTATVYDGTPGTVPNDGTLTIQKNGTTVQTFTANQSSNATANITVPTQFSDLSGTIGTSQIANTAITNAKIDWSDLFTNSDVYHVGSGGTEQIVGKWNDGRNLYRTVIWIGLGENVESVVDMTSYNIYEIVQFFEVMKTNDGSYFPAYYYANGDDWARWYYGGGDKKIHAISRWGSRGMILTLYYTKAS